jgi:hypothetical protein
MDLRMEIPMGCKEWIKLLGKDTVDPKIKDALAKAGLKKVPRIAKDDLETEVELDDSRLVFSPVDLYPSRSEGGDGVYVFSSLVLLLDDYEGELPLKIKRTDSQKDLRSRFGKPVEHDEAFHWDEWKVDDLLVRADYTEDYKSLDALTLSLPREV